MVETKATVPGKRSRNKYGKISEEQYSEQNNRREQMIIISIKYMKIWRAIRIDTANEICVFESSTHQFITSETVKLTETYDGDPQNKRTALGIVADITR